MEEEERQYQQAFGVHTGISEEVRDDINGGVSKITVMILKILGFLRKIQRTSQIKHGDYLVSISLTIQFWKILIYVYAD